LIALARNLYLLYKRREGRLTRWCEFGLGLFAAWILYGCLGDVSSAVSQSSFVNALGDDRLAEITGQGSMIGLGLALALVLAVSAKRLYRLLKSEMWTTAG
jgi:hypothetical protein